MYIGTSGRQLGLHRLSIRCFSLVLVMDLAMVADHLQSPEHGADSKKAKDLCKDDAE